MPESLITFRRDMNGDGLYAPVDAWLWLVHAYFLPGRTFVWLMLTYLPGVARFAELGTDDYEGLFAAITSAIVWVLVFVILGTVYGMVMDLDRAITARVRAWREEWLRRFRVVRRLLVCELRRLRGAIRFSRTSRGGSDEVDLGEIVLSEIELDTLRSHALLAPGYVMSASDLAGSLEIRRSQASQLLSKLEKLALLQRTFSTNEGESGYRLSGSGHFVLNARSRDD